MNLLTFTPEICIDQTLEGCEELVAYARINIAPQIRNNAVYQFSTTIFTCIVLATAFIVFSNDTEVIVIKPIKKVIQIIKTLAENPLKKPIQPTSREETGV